MQIGIVGLGKMGMQIARRLRRKGHKVTAWNRSEGPRAGFSRFGGQVTETLPDLVSALRPPRVVWTMLTAGVATEEALLGRRGLIRLLSRKDTIIDGGNSYYKDTIRRSKILSRKGVGFFDCGTSGGIWGEKKGFSLMVGGPAPLWSKVRPLFKDLSSGSNYGLVGQSGAGHFVKMVHNGIEYGMMEAIAEGFSVINKWDSKIQSAQVARIWQNGSVVRSWLIDLCREIFEQEDFSKVKGFVKHLGEGEWTVKTAKELKVDVRVIADSLKVRKESARPVNQKLFRNKLLALLRNRFGGHEVMRK